MAIHPESDPGKSINHRTSFGYQKTFSLSEEGIQMGFVLSEGSPEPTTPNFSLRKPGTVINDNFFGKERWPRKIWKIKPPENSTGNNPIETLSQRKKHYLKKLREAIGAQGRENYASLHSLDRVTRILHGLEKGREILLEKGKEVVLTSR